MSYQMSLLAAPSALGSRVHATTSMSRIDPLVCAYVAGLFDGDGTVGVYRETLRCGVTLCYKPTLEWLRDLYGVGGIYRTGNNRASHRTAWEWKVSARDDVALVLNALVPWLREKRGQADVYLAMVNGLLTRAEAIRVLCVLKDLTYHGERAGKRERIVVPTDRITLSYSAGYFDAEGCVTSGGTHGGNTSGGLRVELVTKNRPMLDWWVSAWGGRITKHQGGVKWASCARSDVAAILAALRPYLREKAGQADIAIEWAGSGKRLTEGVLSSLRKPKDLEFSDGSRVTPFSPKVRAATLHTTDIATRLYQSLEILKAA